MKKKKKKLEKKQRERKKKKKKGIGASHSNILLSTLPFFFLPGASHMAYGSFQTRGQIGATNASLCHSHSNAGSKPHLQPTPQLMAMLDP